ncbi:MAG TPA: hypothetical protein DEP53_05270 [Bacteroidetes bacterium]|nr:hypothetical protein [Bacteroidota bacterium]
MVNRLIPFLMPMDRIKRLIGRYLPIISVLAVFSVYVFTLLPGVGYSGDTGKFQFVGKVLGIPHEPGSPTYVILNHLLVNAIPFGSTAFKANLISAFFSVLALLVLSQILRLLGIRPFVAAVTILIFGFSYTLWSQSVIAEVYSLCVLFVALTLWLFVRWHKSGKPGDFLLACAVYAVSFGNHLIVVTILPAIVYLAWVTRRDYFWSPRIIVPVLLLIALGAAQYGYLIWRYYSPETSYLEILVPDLRTLWHFVSGGQFQPNFFGLGWKGAIFERLPLLFRFIWLEFLPLTAVSILGYFVLEQRTIRNFLLLAALGTFVFDLIYVVPDIFIYMLPVYVVIAIGLGLGLEWLAAHWSPRYRMTLSIVIALIPAVFITLNLPRADQSKSGEAGKLVEESLRTVGKNSLIICPNYDYAGYFWYYVFAEKNTSDSLFVLYSHEGELPIRDLELYLDRKGTVGLPLQRRNLPDGLAVFYCTAYQPRPFDRG